MKLVVSNEGLILSIGEKIIFTKIISGSHRECPKVEATHILNKETQEAFMLDRNDIIELDEIPSEIEPKIYKYINGSFIMQPKTEPINITDIISRTLSN